MHAGVLMSVAIAACTLLPGCAVNGHGLAWVDWFEGEQGCAKRMRTFGVHLITEAGVEGCVIGWSDLLVCYPIAGADPFVLGGAARRGDPSGDVEEWLARGKLLPIDETAASPTSREGGPIAYGHTTIGVSLTTSPRRFGVSVGYRRRIELAIPLDFDGVTLIDLDTDAPGTSAYGVWETKR